MKYSYVLLEENVILLRYDNSPHHPSIPTHPHHKHLEKEVLELLDWSFEAFLKEATRIISKKLQSKR